MRGDGFTDPTERAPARDASLCPDRRAPLPATHSPTASPSPTHTMTHAMFRDEKSRASVLGRRAAGRSGSGVVLTIGGIFDEVPREGRVAPSASQSSAH